MLVTACNECGEEIDPVVSNLEEDSWFCSMTCMEHWAAGKRLEGRPVRNEGYSRSAIGDPFSLWGFMAPCAVRAHRLATRTHLTGYYPFIEEL